jgi:3-methyladenine DNA glycosylase AlkD
MNIQKIIKQLKSLSNQKNVEGMARFGINPENTLGISIPVLRDMAKKIKKEKNSTDRHKLADGLWQTVIHEARLLAIFIDDYKQVTENQMDNWVKDFDSWDIVDQCCSNLFDKTSYVEKKIKEWVKSEKEFVRRTGLVLMATSAVHNKQMKNEDFIKYFPIIIKYSNDDRNFVRKAVNWALRQIGKRNKLLNKQAIVVAKKLVKLNSKSARWIGSDALRELFNKKIQGRLKK